MRAQGSKPLKDLFEKTGLDPDPNSAKEALEAGKEGRKKEESQVELFRQQFNQLRGVEHWGGRDLRNFRPRGASDGSVEQDPRLLDTSHSRPHAEGISAADWSALGSRPGVTTSSIQSVLEECAGLPSLSREMQTLPYVLDLLLQERAAAACMRRGDPEVEVSGTDLHRRRLRFPSDRSWYRPRWPACLRQWKRWRLRGCREKK